MTDVRRPDILDVARRLGLLTRLKKHGSELVGGCPRCGGKDRFGISPPKQLWLCRGCGTGGDSIDLWRHVTGASFVEAVGQLGGDAKTVRNDFAPASENAKGNKGAKNASADNSASAQRIVRGLGPIKGTDGERYLRETRGIDTDSIADVLELTHAIGWHQAVFFNEPDHALHGRSLGCIVGVMTDPVTAEPTGAISRTYVHEGRKIGPAKTLGAPAGIIRLSKDEDVLAGLHLAEGLETALAAMSIGLRPIWATGSTALMAKFPILSGIEALTVIADNDANGAGAGSKRAGKSAPSPGARRATSMMRSGRARREAGRRKPRGEARPT